MGNKNKFMEYIDGIYGKVNIEETVALELINSPSLQRLKGIDQGGYFLYFWFPDAKNYQCFSRFDHSLGVFILLKKFGAPLKEQVAGLIHDVSHSAFSHCIDYALEEGSEKDQSHQDNIFGAFVRNSEIPDVLKRYGFDIDYILDESNFPLKERPEPDLCADRIDYALRTALFFKESDQETIGYFLNNLVIMSEMLNISGGAPPAIRENFWVFKNLENAKKFAELFFKLNSVYFAGLHSAVMFRTVGDLLKYALEKKYITQDDLYTTEKEVLKKIENNLGDPRLKLFFDRMNNKTKFENNQKDYNAHVFCKSRVVDPLVKINNEIKNLSDIDKKWEEVVKEESMPKEYYLKFYD